MDLLDDATHHVAQPMQQEAQQVQPIPSNMVPTNVAPMVPVGNLTAAVYTAPSAAAGADGQAVGMVLDSDDDDDVPLAARSAAAAAAAGPMHHNGSSGAAAKRQVLEDDDSDDELPLLARSKKQGNANGSSDKPRPSKPKKEQPDQEKPKPKRKAPEASSTPKRARTSTAATEDKPIRWNTLEHAGV